MNPVWAFYWWCRQHPEKAKHLADVRWLAELAQQAAALPESVELRRARQGISATYPSLGENDFTVSSSGIGESLADRKARFAREELERLKEKALELPHLADALADVPSRPA